MLEEAWNNWIECLKGDDINSVFIQISSMIWDTAIYRIIYESRKNLINRKPKSPKINGALHTFIDWNYFISQSLYIRRLIDRSRGLTGAEGIFSVGAIIEDISIYRHELTRETIFRLKNLPYDYIEIQKREQEFMSKQPPGKGFFIPPEYDWESIVEAHNTFDRLSGVKPIDRNPQDVISERVFARLLGKLDVCENFKDYVNKFIAHSATPESRSVFDAKRSDITLRNLWDAQQTIFEVADFLSYILFSEGHLALAIEHPSFFDFWEKPIIEDGEVDKVRSILNAYREETGKWSSTGVINIWNWIES